MTGTFLIFICERLTFFWIFKALATGAAAVAVAGFFPTPFCCLTGTVFLGFATRALGGALTLPAAAFPAAGFLAAPFAAGLAALLPAAALADGLAAVVAFVLGAAAGVLLEAAFAAAAGLGAGVFEAAFFSAGLVAAFGAGAAFDDELEALVPAPLAGADAGFFFSSFLGAKK